MELIDISQPLSPDTAVWPGDQPVEWNWTARIEDGSTVNLGAMCLSVHAGTHVDAPFHVQEEGGRTDESFDLAAFVGPAEVVPVPAEAEAIRPHHLDGVDAERVLFKTEASRSPSETWPDSITPIHPDTIPGLERQGTVLVGTDAPSVDPLDSTNLPAHHALIEAEILNLEGLRLAGVSPGRYQLLALPMNVQGGDAAPVRAVLGDLD